MYDNDYDLFDRVPLVLLPIAMLLTFALCLAAPVVLGYAIAFVIDAL